MDKYEFSIKVEQIRKLVNKSDYETAMKIADTIDWRKVRNANMLSMVAQVYEKNHEYQEAKDILLLAFERAPIGKRLLYKLTDLALKEGNADEAEAYYREFCELSGDDSRQYLLRYKILKARNAPIEQMIHVLENYTAEELDEKWLYELAELYHMAGDSEKCVKLCDKIMLMFGLGKYVDRAMELKVQYAPLNHYQMDLVENRDKYEAKLRAVEQGLTEHDYSENAEEEELETENAEFSEEIIQEENKIEETEELEEPADYKESAIEPEYKKPVEIVMDDDSIIPMTAYSEVYANENLEATVKEAEVEERLAREMSRLANKSQVETENEKGKTKILPLIRRAKTQQEEVMQEAIEEEPELELPKMTNHVMIEARTAEKGLEAAVRTLKKIQAETGIKNPVAKITGSKLNKKGILASADKLAGRDLVIEEAGDLSPLMLKELEQLMIQDKSGMRIILIDNPKQVEMLHAQNPSLASRFECIGSGEAVTAEKQPQRVKHAEATEKAPVRKPEAQTKKAAKQLNEGHHSEVKAAELPVQEEEMDIDEFAQYACEYASEIDCSITGKSMLALYERIEIMEEDGIPLTKTSAAELIEEAADRAENPSFFRKIKSLFLSKYDKGGLLILREEHFI